MTLTLTRYSELLQLAAAIRDEPNRTLVDYAAMLDMPDAAARAMLDELLGHGVTISVDRHHRLYVNNNSLMRFQKWALDHAQDDLDPDFVNAMYRQRGHVLLVNIFAEATLELQLGNARAMRWFESPRAALWADILGHNAEAMVENARRLYRERGDDYDDRVFDSSKPADLRRAFDEYTAGNWTRKEVAARFNRTFKVIQRRWVAIGLIDRTTPEYQEAVTLWHAWYNSGLSMAEYERRHELQEKHLSRIFVANGLRVPPRAKANADNVPDKVREVYEQWRASGLSVSAFERETGRGRSALTKLFRRRGLDVSRRTAVSCD